MNDIEYIENWIENVSKVRPELGGFAVCPYAKKSKYKIEKVEATNIRPEEGYQVIIFIVEDNLTLDQVLTWVKIYNSAYPKWKFFEDYKDRDTYINGVQTNNGKYNLILCQPREKLQNYREILAKTDYYKYWSDDYLKEILEEDINILEK